MTNSPHLKGRIGRSLNFLAKNNSGSRIIKKLMDYSKLKSINLVFPAMGSFEIENAAVFSSEPTKPLLDRSGRP